MAEPISMTAVLAPMIISSLLSGIGSIFEAKDRNKGITQEYILKMIPIYQDMIRKSVYSGLPTALTSISEMTGKFGMTNENQAGIRYAEIADLVQRGEIEAAKLGANMLLAGAQFPTTENWFTAFLKGFYPGIKSGADISSLLMMYNLLKS